MKSLAELEAENAELKQLIDENFIEAVMAWGMVLGVHEEKNADRISKLAAALKRFYELCGHVYPEENNNDVCT
ncbi:hypothetical protein pf16_38 [Pseudomonas phage pf16]|uniref:Uncharacterized protein n=1 Tax=Pseudomonas phage pf16 TaxID=1815630 RepID=A0A1S5R3I8_9CAUD|nr:hypothetical protein FDG98_gp037 [Pseudomonas phage pf16]AND74961.1 hypothetical protein pf16_38 [Pseudomonas phage pf16]